MREIKFRAWDGNRWIYSNGPFGMVWFWAQVEEHGLIVCQCTGLKDMNGVILYEGDVVYAHSNGTKSIVKYGKNYSHELETNIWGWYTHDIWNAGGESIFPENGQECLYLDTDKIYKKIGNIYENPELLED